MNLISLKFSIVLLLMFICIVNVQSSSTSREGKLLGAEWITRDELNANYKGAASMAVVYTASFSSDVVAVVAPDKLLMVGSTLGLVKARVSALVRGMAANHNFVDGEEYTISGNQSVPDSVFSTYKFRPLSTSSKAVVATLPSATNHPPKTGNKDCIVYAYAPNKEGDTTPSSIRLGYLPIVIADNSVCVKAFDDSLYSDTTKYFCATALAPNGNNPYCATGDNLDSYMTAFCPDTSLVTKDEPPKLDLKKEKKWCFILGHWYFGSCPNHPNEPEPKWILTGIMYDWKEGTGCNTINEKLYVVFAYTGNLDLS